MRLFGGLGPQGGVVCDCQQAHVSLYGVRFVIGLGNHSMVVMYTELMQIVGG